MAKEKWLVSSGFLIPIIFWITLLICTLMTRDYDHLTRLVSELGALGSETQYIFTAGLVASSVFSLLFVTGLYKIAKLNGINLIPIWIILSFTFSCFGAAVFPMPLRLHEILGMPSIILVVSPLSALILWNSETTPNVKFYSTLVFLIMFLGFLIYVPNVLSNYVGLKQRFFHVGWTIWFIYLTWLFLMMIKKARNC